VRQLNAVASNRIEMKNLLNISLEGTQERYAKSVRAFCQQWHSVHQKDAVFDKSREWNAMPLAFRDISPDGVMILCVRDLRDIFASCEREEAKNGLITTAPTSVGDRYRALFCEQGVIGNPYRAVLSLMERMPANVHIVRYEDLIADPSQVLAGIEERCGLKPFDYPLNDLPDLSIDCDGWYLGKFPHRAAGKLENKGRHWRDTVPESIAADIVRQAATFYNYFEYMPAPHQQLPAAQAELVPDLPAPAQRSTETATTALSSVIDVCLYT
jgi:sulfotransferase